MIEHSPTIYRTFYGLYGRRYVIFLTVTDHENRKKQAEKMSITSSKFLCSKTQEGESGTLSCLSALFLSGGRITISVNDTTRHLLTRQ